MSAAGKQADDSTVDRLFRLTGGNPFLLREALTLITGSPGSPLAGDVVLPRADAILRRRLARADEMTRQFLRAASVVLDTSDDLAPVTYVMEGDTKDAIAALNKACEIRLMREGPHGEVSFAHALMCTPVWRRISPVRSRRPAPGTDGLLSYATRSASGRWARARCRCSATLASTWATSAGRAARSRRPCRRAWNWGTAGLSPWSSPAWPG
jgi:hypothetical protein